MSARSFRRCSSEGEAVLLAEELRESGIPASVRANAHALNAHIVGQPVGDFHVMVDHADFDRAIELMDSRAVQEAAHATMDHPLFSFTNQELMEVIAKQEEWTPFDVRLAQRLLRANGIPLSDDVLKGMRDDRIAHMRMPEEGMGSLVVTGFVVAVLLPPLAMMIAWHIAHAKKTLPNGEQVLRYADDDRSMAKVITVVAGIATAMIAWWTWRTTAS